MNLLGWVLLSAAHAVTCDEVAIMLGVEVPAAIIVQTIADGDPPTAADLRCLTTAKVPPEVLAAAVARAAEVPVRAAEAPVRATTDAPRPPEPPLPPRPPLLAEAITTFERKRYADATLALAALLPTAADHAPAIHYYLGRSLQELGLVPSAQRHFIEGMNAGPADPYFPYSLARLARTSEHTGDPSDLRRIVAKIPPESFPRSSRNELFYQLGIHLYGQDKLTEARKYLGQVSDKDDRYWTTKYLEGVVYSRQGKLKSGVRSFAAVVKGYDTPAPGAPVPSRALRDLAQLSLGGTYYSIENFAEAIPFLTLPPDSPHHAEGQLRVAWCHFMLGADPRPTLDALPADAWLPEADVIRGVHHFNASRYAEAIATAEAFERRYRTVEVQLRAILGRYTTEEGRKLADEAFRRYGVRGGSPLPPALLTKVYRDAELAGLAQHLALLTDEERKIRRRPRAWRDAVGTGLLAGIVEDRARLERRAGLVLLQGLVNETTYLGDLLYQAKVLRFDATDAAGQPSGALLREVLAATEAGPRRVEVLLGLATQLPEAEALTLYAQIVTDHPGANYADEAAWHLARLDPTRRFEMATRLVEGWPTSRLAPQAWLLIGEHHFAHNALAEARAAYVRAAADPKGPFYAYATYKLGWTLYALGDRAGGYEQLGLTIAATTDEKLRADATAERAKLGGP